MATEITGSVDEKDGALIIKGEDGAELRYVKESDLLAVKGSRDTIEKTAKEAEAALVTASTETAGKVEAERQKVLLAEAKVSTLEEQIKAGGASATELAQAKQDLVTAKSSGEELGNKFLELRRSVVVATYNIPVATVASKSLAELDVFEEALKAVIGSKGVGNYAIGGGGGGASDLVGKSPMELAQIAYSEK